MLNSINTALQKEGISKANCFQTIPNHRLHSKKLGRQHFMSDLHLWMQASSEEGETMLLSVESTDKFDNSTLAVDC